MPYRQPVATFSPSEEKRSRRGGTRHSGPLTRARRSRVPFSEVARPIPVGRASRPPSEGQGVRRGPSRLGRRARPRRPRHGFWRSLLEAGRSRRGGTRHSGPLARAWRSGVPFSEVARPTPVGRASRPPGDGQGRRESARMLGHRARPRRPRHGFWRSLLGPGRLRCGGTRHPGPLTRACVPYYQHTGKDLDIRHASATHTATGLRRRWDDALSCHSSPSAWAIKARYRGAPGVAAATR